MQKKKILGAAAIISAGALWGVSGAFVRGLGAKGFDSMQIVALRVVITAVVMTLALLIYKPSLLKIKLRDCWCFAGTGLCSIVMFSFCYFKTMTLTSLSVAAILLYTAPVLVMLMSVVFFKEKLSVKKVVACALALCGCVLVTGVLSNTAAVPPLGILTGIGSSVGYALYSIFSRVALNKGYHSLTITAYTFIFAVIGVVPLTDWSTIPSRIDSGSTVLLIIAIGFVTTVFPYILYTGGLTYIESSRASIMASVEPVIATLTGVIVYNEALDIAGVAGVGLVLSALVIINLRGKQNAHSQL